MTKKSFFLDQHGCAKNQVDGELILSSLQKKGWIKTSDPNDASLIIINSCGFIESAKKESLESVIQARNDFPDKKIVLCGCLAERYADDFSTELQEVDGIFGNGNMSLFEQFAESVLDKKNDLKPLASVSLQKGVCADERIDFLGYPNSVYIKITEGCNNRCTFCAIPLIRGNLRSRKISDIVKEIKQLLDRGFFEINLVGQDLGSFGMGEKEDEESEFLTIQEKNIGSPLSLLLKEISKLSGNFWIRLLYIHPDNFPRDILPVMLKDKRILPYFDIPFQSGDTNIIKAMNRRGNAETYKELINDIRLNFEQSEYRTAIIRTTFLCGFPGEDEKSFNNTKKFLEDIQSDWSGCFAYSKEDGTKAYSFKNQVNKKTSAKREKELQLIQSEITEKRLKRFVGQLLQVFIEELVLDSENSEGIAIGRAWFQAADVDGSVVVRYELSSPKQIESVKPGKVILAKIIGSTQIDVDAIFIDSVE